MPKPWCVAVVAIAVMFAVVGTVGAQSGQRFNDVPPDHPEFAAVEWAAHAGVTHGYGDGTFRPEEPLSLSHATVFLNRYYEEILGADVSADFTRSDMMRVLFEMAGAPGQGSSSSDSEEGSSDAREEPPIGTPWVRHPTTSLRQPCEGGSGHAEFWVRTDSATKQPHGDDRLKGRVYCRSR